MLDRGRTPTIICPECRETVKIEDVASLKVNIWVNKSLSLLELSKAEKKQDDGTELMCNNCDSKEVAKGKCFDCDTFVCDFCMTLHQRLSKWKDHQVKTFEEINITGIPAAMEKNLFCGKHKGKKQKLFCIICEELICRDCTIIDHKDHDICFIVDIVQEHKEKLIKEIKTASATKEKVEVSLKSVQVMKKRAQDNLVNTEKSIDQVINKQIQALEQKRINLKQESRDMTATTMKNLTAQEDGLAMHMTGLKTANEFTENVLSKGSNSDVLSMSKHVVHRLSQLSAKPFDREVVYDVDKQVILLVDERLISNGIAKFAKVIDGSVPDPEQCEVRWMQRPGDGSCAVYTFIKNSLGEPLSITEDRIDITSDHPDIDNEIIHNEVFTQHENGIWLIKDPYIHPPPHGRAHRKHKLLNVYIKIEDVASLKVNIWVNKNLSLLELSKAEKKQDDGTELICNNCDSKEAAKGRCFDCDTFVCDFCITLHQRLSVLKDHQVKTFEEIKITGIPAAMEKNLFCGKHKGEMQKLFCKTCEVLICRDCTIIDHKDHDICFIVDIAQEHKEKLTKEIKTASTTKEKVEVSLKSVQRMKERAKENSDNTEKRIDDVINKQIQALEEKRNSLKQESRDITATTMKNLTAQEDGLVMQMTGLKSAIEFTENVLSKGSNSDVLSMSKQVVDRLSQLSAKPFDREVKDVYQLVLQVDERLISDGIAKLAKVIDGVPDPAQCEVRWEKKADGRDVIHTYIKNSLGEPLNITKDRITFTTDDPIIDTEILHDGLFTPYENGIWSIEDPFFHPPRGRAHGLHTLVNLNIKVDGHLIKGNPIELCFG
ncbi:hypothetical protein QZH41_014788 [Actinostola sp. cb2023]|nr:hypothetical protein QZH41_014788 [Actinostola sp. cb2023]